VIAILKNPFYAGVYIYGKTEHRGTLVDGRVRKTYHHQKPLDQWEVIIKDQPRELYRVERVRAQSKVTCGEGVRQGGRDESARGGRALLPDYCSAAAAGVD